MSFPSTVFYNKSIFFTNQTSDDAFPGKIFMMQNRGAIKVVHDGERRLADEPKIKICNIKQSISTRAILLKFLAPNSDWESFMEILNVFSFLIDAIFIKM